MVQNPVCKEIFQIYNERLSKSQSINSEFFVKHQNVQISSLSVDLLSNPHVYSDNWKKKHGIDLRSQLQPDLNFVEDARQAVLHYKLTMLQKKIDLKSKELSDVLDKGAPRQEQLLRLISKLNQKKIEISSQIRSVIFR